MKHIAPGLFLFCQLAMAPSLAQPLLEAARANDGAQVVQSLTSGADIRAQGPQGDTALHWAAFHGDESMARRLIDAGAGVDARVNNGSTPLHLAAYNGHAGVVKILIAHGAKVNVGTHAGITPLDWAKRNGHREVAQLLAANGARPGKEPSVEETPADRHASRPEQTDDLPELNRILTKYRLSKARGRASTPDRTAGEDDARREGLTREKGFRIQLAAFGSEQRAVETWARFQKQHPEILGRRKLMLHAISSAGKKYYRVQTGEFTRSNARSLCARLKRRSQPCIVIKPVEP